MAASENKGEVRQYEIEGTEGGKPFRRVYEAADQSLVGEFDAIVTTARGEQEINRALLDDIVAQGFPDLALVSDVVLEDVEPGWRRGTVSDSMPIGHDEWSQNEKVKLLRRTLQEKRRAVRASIRAVKNEMASNLPTFYALATTGETSYAVAAACGLAIAAAISYRGYTQYKEFERSMQIWCEFRFNAKHNKESAVVILSDRMHHEGLLFAGVPDNMGEFSHKEFTKAAEEMGLWDRKQGFGKAQNAISLYDRKPTAQKLGDVWLATCHWGYNYSVPGSAYALQKVWSTAKGVRLRAGKQGLEKAQSAAQKLGDAWLYTCHWGYNHSVPESAHTLQKVWLTAGDTFAEQFYEGKDNVTKPETYKNIAKGLWTILRGLVEFKVLKNESREHKKVKPQSEELPNIRIEENRLVRNVVDSKSLDEVAEVRADFRRRLMDGKVIGIAHGAETGFVGSHAYEVVHACGEGDLWAIGLSLWSLGTVSGAYSFLGHELSSLFAVLTSLRARMLQLYPVIEQQYHDRKGNGAAQEVPELTA